MKKSFIIIFGIAFGLLGPAAVSAAERPARLWTLPSSDATEVRQIPIPAGSSLAAADLGADGIAEILVGSPLGAAPSVRTLRADGSTINSFPVFDKGMVHGITVAAADLDGDGKREILAAAGIGAVGHLVILDSRGNQKLAAGGFYPYGRDFRGGLNLASADLDGDGRAEIVAAPASGNAPIKIFSPRGIEIGSFEAFDEAAAGGVSLAAADLDGDGLAEIAAAPASGGAGLIKIFNGKTHVLIREFAAFNGGFRGGLSLATLDINNDGSAEIFAAPLVGGGPQVRMFDFGGRLRTQFFAAPDDAADGLVLAVGHLRKEGVLLLAAPAGTDAAKAEYRRYIEVDATKQRLRAYENGRLVRTFLVSTGKVNKPTPLGAFSVLAKPYEVLYRGPGYDYGRVPWNLRFKPGYYLHYAPWHFDFGRRRSSGCVNIDRANAEWIYNWAEVGTPVEIHA